MEKTLSSLCGGSKLINMNFKLEVTVGDNINDTIVKAIKLSKELDKIVEFNFNGILILINENSIPSLIRRDYDNSHVMEWKTIGPEPDIEYDLNLQYLIAIKKLKAKDLLEKSIKDQKEKDIKDRSLIDFKLEGIEMTFSDYIGWNRWKDNQIDEIGYGKAIFEFAEYWARLMQYEIIEGNLLKDIYKKTSFELDFLGVSGSMYYAAKRILEKTWIHGEELKNLN